jgi:hypothetical protein
MATSPTKLVSKIFALSEELASTAIERDTLHLENGELQQALEESCQKLEAHAEMQDADKARLDGAVEAVLSRQKATEARWRIAADEWGREKLELMKECEGRRQQLLQTGRDAEVETQRQLDEMAGELEASREKMGQLKAALSGMAADRALAQEYQAQSQRAATSLAQTEASLTEAAAKGREAARRLAASEAARQELEKALQQKAAALQLFARESGREKQSLQREAANCRAARASTGAALAAEGNAHRGTREALEAAAAGIGARLAAAETQLRDTRAEQADGVHALLDLQRALQEERALGVSDKAAARAAAGAAVAELQAELERERGAARREAEELRQAAEDAALRERHEQVRGRGTGEARVTQVMPLK